MLATMQTLFPEGADWSKASYWAGLRPMTPEGTPILGPSRLAQSVVQHRPRPYGLDHESWRGADHRRSHRRKVAGHTARRHDAAKPRHIVAANPRYVAPQQNQQRENCRMKFMCIAAIAAVLGLSASIWPGSADAAQTGMASYYKSGSRTANGERFNPHGLTAAHRTLPFGTRVLVTNLRNGKSVVVRINDRGPFSKGRVIDLSLGAATVVGLTTLRRRQGQGRPARLTPALRDPQSATTASAAWRAEDRSGRSFIHRMKTKAMQKPMAVAAKMVVKLPGGMPAAD